MKIRKIYISDDGEEFDSEEACLEHENVFSSSDSVVMFDSGRRLIEDRDSYIAYEKAEYIYISNAKRAETFFNWVEKELQFPVPKEPEAGHTYYFDEKKDAYIDINWKIHELASIRRHIQADAKALGKYVELEGRYE